LKYEEIISMVALKTSWGAKLNPNSKKSSGLFFVILTVGSGKCKAL